MKEIMTPHLSDAMTAFRKELSAVSLQDLLDEWSEKINLSEGIETVENILDKASVKE